MASFHPSGDSASFEIIMGFVKVKGPIFFVLCGAFVEWICMEYIQVLQVISSDINVSYFLQSIDRYIYIYGQPPQDLPISFLNGIYSIKCLFCKSKK